MSINSIISQSPIIDRPLFIIPQTPLFALPETVVYHHRMGLTEDESRSLHQITSLMRSELRTVFRTSEDDVLRLDDYLFTVKPESQTEKTPFLKEVLEPKK